MPLGTRRATHRDRVRTQERRRDRLPVRPRRDRTPTAGRRSWIGRVLSGVALAVGLFVIWFLVELFQPFHGSAQGTVTVTVTIPAHSSSSQIGDQLEREGVIGSSFFFSLRAILAGDRGSLLAGTYRLKQDMSYGDVLSILSTPPPAAKVTNVTIVEGRTRQQIDRLLRSQGVLGSYLADTRRSPLLDPRPYGAPAGLPSLEGFLFPSTYQVLAPLRISALVADQLKEFKKVFATVNLSHARSRNMTPYDVLIIASIIEKEAATTRDRPLVAAVIYNRLRDHVPLGMDSTTRYEFDDYNRALTQSQLASPSPYNTRLHLGLPPTPIS
ncbi:MAG TPA: endolytic transglycosylase MltG, partial [Solirubrobacteraceae bacterium]